MAIDNRLLENLIGINESELDTKIYRIFPLNRLDQLFQNNEITLVKPKLWDDPWENAILKAVGVEGSGAKVDIAGKDYIFSQSWTLTDESDAMWRIYSPNQDSVRIETTVRKIFEALIAEVELRFPPSYLRAFIGRVSYYDRGDCLDRLQSYLSDGNLFTSNGIGYAGSLLFKRSAFEHEQEIRAIIITPEEKPLPDIFHIKVNPHDFVESIMFDPRATNLVVQMQRDYIQSKLNFNGPMMRSSLYDEVQLTFRL